jgi:hypothetical protein
MASLQVQVETERPGIVTVRAKPAPGREFDAKPIGGFYVRRRYAGDEFKIAKWQDFSPRWMEFVKPEEVPTDWIEAIKAREGAIEVFAQEAAEQDSLSPEERRKQELMSMADLARGGDKQTINQATGAVRQTLSRRAE